MITLSDKICKVKLASGKSCGRHTFRDDVKCIFHHENKSGTVEAKIFENRFWEELRRMETDENIKDLDFTGFIFPISISFHEHVFKKPVFFVKVRFNEEAIFSGAQFNNEVNFSEAQFNNKSYFIGTQFNNKADFMEARFNNRVIFSGAFNNRAIFSGAQFNKANFSGTKFNEAIFSGAQFNNEASFSEARFDSAYFTHAQFNRADFSKTQFDNMVYFYKAQFNGAADLSRVQFGNGADFSDAEFIEEADFRWAKFGNRADFSRVQFGNGAYFSQAQFSDEANFSWAEFDNGAYFSEAQFNNKTKFYMSTFMDEVRFIWTKFNNESFINFEYSKFHKPKDVRFQNVNLSNISFLYTDITEVEFLNEEWAKKNGRLTAVDESRIMEDENITYEAVAQLYRRLRRNYEDNYRFAEAGNFFIGEMEMRRLDVTARFRNEKVKKIELWFKRNFSLLGIYKHLSFYGESYIRPAIYAFIVIISYPMLMHWLINSSLPDDSTYMRTSAASFFQMDNKYVGERLIGIPILGLLFIALKRRFERKR